MPSTPRLNIPLLTVAQEHKEVSINDAFNTFDAACMLLTEPNDFTEAVTFSKVGNGVTFADGVNVVFGTSTGSQLGTAANQKIGLWGATPVVQRPSTTDLRQVFIDIGALASGGATPCDLNGGSLTASGSSNSLGATTLTGSLVAATASNYFTRSPAASTQFGNVNIGDGGFAGGSGHYAGGSGGSLLAINLVSGGTADVINAQINGVSKFKLGSGGNVTFGDGTNLVFNTSTGTIIGSATNQKFAFWGATPVSQLAGTTDIRTGLITLGLWASGGATPLNTNGGDVTCGTMFSSGGFAGSGTAMAFLRNAFTFAADADETLGSTAKAKPILDVQTGVISTTRAIICPGTAGGTYFVINRNANSVDVKTSGNTPITVPTTRACVVCFPGGTNAFQLTPFVDYSTGDVKGVAIGRQLTLCAGFTPAATGADTAEFIVPYDPRDGTTSVTWNIRRCTLRVGTAGGAPAVKIQKSTAGNAAFGSGTDVVTLTMTSGENLVTSTTSLGTVASGNYLRFNVTTLGTATDWTILVELGATT